MQGVVFGAAEKRCEDSSHSESTACEIQREHSFVSRSFGVRTRPLVAFLVSLTQDYACAGLAERSFVFDLLQEVRERLRTADMWAVSAGQLNRLCSEQLS